MKSLYGRLKPIYKRAVPCWLQRATWDRRYPFYRLVEPLKHLLQRSASHDEIYDSYYFEETIEGPMLASSRIIAESIVEHFQPSSVIDVGCGTGALLSEFRKAGVRGFGLDNAEAALRSARQKGVEVARFDLEAGFDFERTADLVISTEVAEHLPADCADRFVQLLVDAGDTVLMTAAPPGQGGTDHVNEQPNEYWIEKFRNKGFDYDRSITQKCREQWAERGAQSFYANNVLVFRRT